MSYTLPTLLKILFPSNFTIDNNVSVEFDPFGFNVKDFPTGTHLTRCSAAGDLYAISTSTRTAALPSANITLPSTRWHDRLGHPGMHVLHCLQRSDVISCNKDGVSSHCFACQIAKHKRLPFYDSQTHTFAPFDLIHSDIWTSPVPSETGYRYYLVFLDDFTNFVWIFPLKYKSETFAKFHEFTTYVQTQFNSKVKQFQCDMGGEYNNTAFLDFCKTKGILVRFACPQTSPQNGRAERILRTLNDVTRSLLYHASLPLSYWVEALNMSAYLHNILPTKTLALNNPTFALFHRHPSYDHIRVFGCLCFPNTVATSPHKLAPRSSACVFLGFSKTHRGYRCMDLNTKRVHISRHVVFDETTFPFKNQTKTTQPNPDTDPSPAILSYLQEALNLNPNPTTPLPKPTTHHPLPPPPLSVTETKTGGPTQYHPLPLSVIQPTQPMRAPPPQRTPPLTGPTYRHLTPPPYIIQ